MAMKMLGHVESLAQLEAANQTQKPAFDLLNMIGCTSNAILVTWTRALESVIF